MSDSSTSEVVNVDADGNSSYEASQGTDSDADADTDMDTTEAEDGKAENGAEYEDFDRNSPHTANGTGDDSGDNPHVIKMIQQGQKLYALLDQIHNPQERELYAGELVNVGALLAYPHPESSPLD
jgi:hypothetical protein